VERLEQSGRAWSWTWPALVSRALLFAEDFLYVPDFLLDLAGNFFVGAAIPQIGIADGLSTLLFNFAFGFPETAFDFVFRA
jgi:hypothetical protein